jgi:glutamine amidotransferase-like uncharacterized protein
MKPRIALFMEHPECSMQCVNGMIRSLQEKYEIKIVSREFYTKENLKEFDVVAFPGGIGDADSYYTFFKRRHGNVVEDFINSGGHYLGICMGAYWAGSNYFDILKDVEPVQYIKRDDSSIRRSYATVAKVNWEGQEKDMFFYDGCSLIGDESKFDTVARYVNGDPMAIIQGRVGLIGCHPESEEFWYEDNYKYLKNYWHEGKHHKLLLDFLNKLVHN